jgi:diguanylate cyclase (GGDEF)-like protein
MKPKFKELLFASFDYEEYNPEQTKVLLLNAMFFITITINLIFMIINVFITHTYLMFFVNLFIVLFLGYALYILREKNQYTLASYIGNAILFISFLSIVILKHSEDYSLVWTFFFAPFAILTLGAKKGLMLSIVFMAIVLSASYTGIGTWDSGRWNLETFFRITIALFVMLYVIYTIQNNNEKANGKIIKLRQKEKLQLKLLEKLSITDTLTSLYNRRFFEEIFPRQILRAESNQEFLTFFVLDLDYFKQYNDTYGHQKGDTALVQVSEVLKEVFYKSDDYTFRIGGEEFAGIFLDEAVANIHDRINAILKSLNEKNIEHLGNPSEDRLTCSIGVYILEVKNGLTHQEIYRLADEALYKAKEKGRTQIVYACSYFLTSSCF